MSSLDKDKCTTQKPKFQIKEYLFISVQSKKLKKKNNGQTNKNHSEEEITQQAQRNNRKLLTKQRLRNWITVVTLKAPVLCYDKDKGRRTLHTHKVMGSR